MSSKATQIIDDAKRSVHKAIVGKDAVLNTLICALLCEGHVLIEDVPGVGKTSMAAALAAAAGCSFGRIQFTPDVMPADITGFSMPSLTTGEFSFKPGMIHAQIVLADEINRATAKTQSALLEAMEERQVTVDGKSIPLPRPFMVLATQNPTETAGTYPLPESQLDRFFVKVSMGYPEPNEELEIMSIYGGEKSSGKATQVLTADTILKLQEYTRKIHVADVIRKYIVLLVGATRRSAHLRYGVSPRGTLALLNASQAYAVTCGDTYVTPKHVQAMVQPVLSHRLMLTPKARAEGISADKLLQEIMEATPIPTGRKEA